MQWTETFFGALFMQLVVALGRAAMHCVPASEVMASEAERVFVHALLVRQKAFVADLNITHGACWGSVAAALLANWALWVTVGCGVFFIVVVRHCVDPLIVRFEIVVVSGVLLNVFEIIVGTISTERFVIIRIHFFFVGG
jgi:hypothetical protein